MSLRSDIENLIAELHCHVGAARMYANALKGDGAAATHTVDLLVAASYRSTATEAEYCIAALRSILARYDSTLPTLPSGYITLSLGTAYRPGPPPVWAVRAHEEYGGWWMSLRTEQPIIAATEGVFISHLTVHDGEVYADDIEYDEGYLPSAGWSHRPIQPDGTPCAWPTEPEGGSYSAAAAHNPNHKETTDG